ncbi:DUF1178 family protein [Magnetospira sp. QH-2]|uniref:DUF1178 family protein n=1 Tax=Magnetospira sp. (strain QH-2) TaxID=1288970 RepID=UPI0003E81B66|nr:DUF1178 family protein [Magnetospira sp. QH-2]CCQ72958.1 conserved hypothetical protein [Magnetospira sp. QH-2]
MILYQLKCGNGHSFEAWFKDSASYDDQQRHGDIACPHCGEVTVSKAPMAPRINSSVGESAASGDFHEARARELAERILDAVSELRDHVEGSCDYVGDDFPEEARRIHYGESDQRGIYGEASAEEAEDMQEEGIEFYMLPGRPKQRSS